MNEKIEKIKCEKCGNINTSETATQEWEPVDTDHGKVLIEKWFCDDCGEFLKRFNRGRINE